jgi:hypothetical protein
MSRVRSIDDLTELLISNYGEKVLLTAEEVPTRQVRSPFDLISPSFSMSDEEDHKSV